MAHADGPALSNPAGYEQGRGHLSPALPSKSHTGNRSAGHAAARPDGISHLMLLEDHLERSDLDDASIVQQRIVDDSAIHPCPIE